MLLLLSIKARPADVPVNFETIQLAISHPVVQTADRLSTYTRDDMQGTNSPHFQYFLLATMACTAYKITWHIVVSPVCSSRCTAEKEYQ